MAQLLWKGYDIDNFVKAIEFLNSFEWNMTWKQIVGGWQLWAGDQTLFESET